MTEKPETDMRPDSGRRTSRARRARSAFRYA
jgi:hypothetical protein